MLVSRRDIDQFPLGSVSCLQRFSFYGNSDIEADLVQDVDAANELRRLMEEGLVVNNGSATVFLRL
ncbi:hypothetical protein L218DRAFT_962604 [Marasmius fiardii PR-910]|nr:hypothetical protein L218DRAFT_962604 [Marasmius fiardii PR-910]